MTDRFEIVLMPTAQRALQMGLPEKIATAAIEFIMGPLRDNPRRVGKPLLGALAPLYSARRGEYRILYRILEQRLVIEVVTSDHRRDAYRPH